MGKVIKFKAYEEKGDCIMNIKLAKAIIFVLVESGESVYKTKLNKLLFYAQFLYAKLYGGQDLIEETFIKDYYGPAIENLGVQLNEFKKQGWIQVNENGYGTVIAPLVKFKDSNYTKEEKIVLKTVANKFKGVTATAISDISHKEPLWIDRSIKEEIPLNEAYKLIDLKLSE